MLVSYQGPQCEIESQVNAIKKNFIKLKVLF